MDMLDPKLHATPAHFFWAVNKKVVPLIVLNSFFYSLGTVAMIIATYFLGVVVNDVTAPSHGDLVPYLWGIAGLILAYEVCYRIGHVFEIAATAKMRRNVKRSLLAHTTALSFGYFADRFAGEIAHKISKTSDAMERLVSITSNIGIEESVMFLVSGIALSFVSPALGVFILVWSTLFLSGIGPVARRSNDAANAFAVAEAHTTGTFVDLYTNIAAVKVYGSESSRAQARRQIESEVGAYKRMGIWNIVIYHYMGLSIVIFGSGLIALTTELFARGAISIGDIVFISGIGLRLIMNVWDVGRNVPDFIRNLGEAEQSLRDLVVAPAVVDGDRVSSQKGEKIGVDYKNVTFGYSREKPVLENFSMRIEPGQKVGIVGLSGAGKTTFANLLLRFFDVQGGSILLNGEDIRDFTQEFIRSHISYISQDTSLFHASVAENIAYGVSAASPETIERAARLAYAEEFINELPHGYKSIVGERGVKLSGGQRQRIAIARAILADRPLFLLDEATSALDSDSEHKIQKGLEALMEGKTVIAIAHRLSTLSRMDRIVFLESGIIVEDGSHEALLERGGKYAALWNMQAGGFLRDEL